MKFLRSLSKFAALPLIFALILPFSACVKDKRFDYSELNLRLKAAAPEYAFDESDLFFADGVYYCYYSLGEADDTLLTMKEDARGKLDRITLTLAASPEDARFDAFRSFALALAEIFVPDADPEALRAQTLPDDPAAMLAATILRYEQGFYSASVFASAPAVCIILRYEATHAKNGA